MSGFGVRGGPCLVPLLNGQVAPGTMGAMAVSFLGVIVALAMYAVSVAPSLMARSWAWHAVASGVLVSCGYVAGVVVQNVGARVIAMTGLTIHASEPVEIGFRACVAALFAIWWLYAVIQSYRRARVAAWVFWSTT